MTVPRMTELIDRETRLNKMLNHQRRTADAIAEMANQVGIDRADAILIRDTAQALVNITIAIEEESA